jgi:hypothetical protein
MGHFGHSLTFWRMLTRTLSVGLLIVVLVSSTGCTVIERLYSSPAAQTPVPSATGAGPLPSATSQAPTATQPVLPTYTPQPTYTLLPTYTPLPTYTLPPPFTPMPVIIQPSPLAALPTPYANTCCTLRVRNRSRTTLWIGTSMPYGGNYIRPLQYVEFYLPGATWVRVWWCRYRWAPNEKWYKNDKWYEDEPWRSDYMSGCLHRDVYVDEPLMEISVN